MKLTMIKREHVLMVCVGILLLSCVYLLWENRRLKKMNPSKSKSKSKEPVIETETETEAESKPTDDVEETPEQDAMNYYVNENIPDDLKEELNNLNLEENETIEDSKEADALESVEADVLEIVEADVLESVEADVLESVEADVLESVEAEAETNELIDISDPGTIEEIVIDARPEDDEILNLELELEKKLKASMSKYNEESLNAMNLKQLSDICRENKLKIKGKKSELIERILTM